MRYSFDAPRVQSPEGFHHTNFVVDLDGDGRMDTATAFGNDLIVHYGEGRGAFSEPQTVRAAFVTRIGDVIGDPLPDLLANGKVYENRGGRTFGEATALPIRGREIAGDFNGDGRSDLLIAHSGNQLLVMRRTAEGKLEPETASSMGDDVTIAVTHGDFDGDGDLDIAAPAMTAAVRLFLNQGNGSFVAGAVYATSVAPEVIDAADLDRDGRTDVLALTTIPAAKATSVEVFYGSGRTATFPLSGEALFGARLLVTSLNPDASPDVIVSVMGSKFTGYYVLMNDGFGALRDVEHVAVRHIYDIAAGDATGDGHTDLLVPRVFGQELLPGKGTGKFDTPRTMTDVYGFPHAVKDFDGDGIDELLYFSSDRVSIRWNDSGETFRTEVISRNRVDSLSVTNDGLAAYDASNRAVYMLTRAADGTWRERRVAVSPQGFATMHVADVNRDGAAELVMIDPVYQLGNTLSVTSGREDRVLSSLFIPGAHVGTSVAFDDMNGDGLLDLLLAFSGTQDPKWGVPPGTPQRNGSIALFAGQANGTFARSADLLTGASPRRVSTGDFNGDGRRDALTVTYDGQVFVMYGTATGVRAELVVEDSFYSLGVTTSDFDRDGITDLIVATGDSFLSFRGTAEGLVAHGRFSSARNGVPLAARMRGKASPSLIFPTSYRALVIETTCTFARRRSVR
jgi:hypothetical protein